MANVKVTELNAARLQKRDGVEESTAFQVFDNGNAGIPEYARPKVVAETRVRTVVDPVLQSDTCALPTLVET